MRAFGVLVCALASCGRLSFQQNPQGSSDAATADGKMTTDAPGGSFCLGPAGWSVCMTAVPTQPMTLPATIDTGATGCQPPGVTWSGQPSACFVIATDISIPADVVVAGAAPLVLVATGAITVSATLDASSHRGGSVGPAGGNASSCTAFASTPNLDNSGGGGGAGASFVTKGGNGGTGNNNAANAGTAPGVSAGAPTVLRGGCSGQNGGDGIGTASHGTGGAGGGAVYLLAGSSIALESTALVDASGAAGSPGVNNQFFGGGGGGGSGGMIVLYAPAITAVAGAMLLADGGGGSAGSSGTQVGAPGTDPSSPAIAAAGGAGPGGAGGAGDVSVVNATTGGGGGINLGGGGGGGGAGYIRSNLVLSNASASPAVSIVP